jgi:CheY-like chemotaxis protein
MKERLLIVDDAPENLDFLGAVLQDKYKIVAARDGEKALQLAGSSNPPALILLDLMLPGISGFEVCRKLKDDPATREIPVLFITGSVDFQDLQRGFELGGADFIFKPFNHLLILHRVATHLELKRLRAE